MKLFTGRKDSKQTPEFTTEDVELKIYTPHRSKVLNSWYISKSGKNQVTAEKYEGMLSHVIAFTIKEVYNINILKVLPRTEKDIYIFLSIYPPCFFIAFSTIFFKLSSAIFLHILLQNTL